MSNKRGGLLFGVIMGTLLGVLFAPKKGKELRKEFQNEVSKGGFGTETLKKNFKEMGSDMADTAQEVYAMPEVQEQVNKGKKHVDTLMKKVGGQLKAFGQKFMGDIGFTKKPISKSTKSSTAASKVSPKKRSRKVKIHKKP